MKKKFQQTDRRLAFVRSVLGLFYKMMPGGDVELRDFINDGKLSGQHLATSWSNDHKILVDRRMFDLYPREIGEVLDTICHEAHHAMMHDIDCMLSASGKLNEAERNLILERAAYCAGRMVSKVVANIDDLKKQYAMCTK